MTEDGNAAVLAVGGIGGNSFADSGIIIAKPLFLGRFEADFLANCLGQGLKNTGVLIENPAVLQEDDFKMSKTLVNSGKALVKPVVRRRGSW